MLYHGSDGQVHVLGDGEELKHWKYIKKIKTGNGWRYFYSQDEINAYMKEVQGAAKGVKKKIDSIPRLQKHGDKYYIADKKTQRNIENYNANGFIKTLGDIEHYNHNHDALGRFARGGGMLSGSKRSIRKANKKELQVLDSFDKNIESGNDPYPHKKSVKALNDYKKEHMKNRQSVVNSVRSDFKNDKEYRRLKKKNEEAYRKFVKEYDKLESASKSYNEEKFNKVYKEWRETDSAVYAKQQQIVDKHAHEFASAYLKDLGIKETKRGKKYVLKNMQKSYHVEVDSEHPNDGNVPWDTYESVSNKMLTIEGNNYDPSYQTRRKRKEVYNRRKQYMK